MTSPPLAALITMSESRYRHEIVYTDALMVECDAQRAKVATLEAERDEWKDRSARNSARARELRECPACRWPTPGDNDHYICGCCGCHIGYDDPPSYAAKWDGQWWDSVERKPAILEALESSLTSARLAREEALRETADAKHQLALTINLFGTADTKREAAEAEARSLRERLAKLGEVM